MSLSNNYPNTRPSLLLDFARAQQLDPRVAFTRSSTGTYYDGETEAKAEENLLLQSQEFDNTAAWGVDGNRGAVTANSTLAPDGTLTADTFTDDATAGSHNINSIFVVSITSGLAYTISVFAKKNTHDFFQIATFGSGNPLGTGRANFDLATGVVGTVAGGTSTITSAGNGWYRCTYTVTATASGTIKVYFSTITTSTAVRFESYTGTGTSIYLWGAQLEQRSAVTAYTATTTQPITNYVPVLLTAQTNIPRFTFNPVTDESLGLLVEEQRTNVMLYSEDLTNAVWQKNRGAVIANTVVAPDGTLTGDKWYEDTQTGAHHIAQNFAAIPADNAVVTISVFAKAAERTKGAISLYLKDNATYITASFDLVAATISTGSAGYTTAIQNVGDGWYRISLSGSCGAGATSPRLHVFLSNGSTTAYTGNGYSGMYLWGAQAETGPAVTSYVPTVASQVTRAADVANISGTNFSSWYNNAEGSFFIESVVPVTTTDATTRLLCGVSNGSFNQSMYFGRSASSAAMSVSVIYNGVSQVGFGAGNAIIGAPFKFAVSYKVDNFAGSFNSTIVTDTSGSTAIVNGFTIGNGNWSGANNWINSTISKISYYPVRLTNAQLQALTGS